MDELRASLEKKYAEQLESARDQWEEEEIARIKDEVMKDKEQLLEVVRLFQLFCLIPHCLSPPRNIIVC